jgi:hypothetical protein
LFFPAVWPFAYLVTKNYLKDELRSITNLTERPVPQPWDCKFGENKACWIIVYLKDGTSIGGWYGKNSYCSSSPSKEQIYLEEVYEVDEDGVFGADSVRGTEGILILGDEISAIEFFKSENDHT